MKKVGLILFASAYLYAGIYSPTLFIAPCEEYFNRIALSMLHFAARLTYKKVAAKEAPILQKREIGYYLLAYFYWESSYFLTLRDCY